MTQNSHHHKPLMVQAPVRALDPDGMTVITAGTVAFGVAVGVCWWLLPQLGAAGKGWYLGTSVVGFCLGLVGLGISLRRRHRRRSAGSPRLAVPTSDAATGTAEPLEGPGASRQATRAARAAEASLGSAAEDLRPLAGQAEEA